MRAWSIGFAAAAAWGDIHMAVPSFPSYDEELAFLRRHVEVIELTDEAGRARVAVVPAWQGRVATSTSGGGGAPGYGWLNRPVIERGIRPPAERRGTLEDHIHVFGGEERFWLGPEGGQFSVYFPPGAPFEFEHWRVPPPIDTEPFRLTSRSRDRVRFEHQFVLTNWSGHIRACRVERIIQLLDARAALAVWTPSVPGGLEAVAYETDNRLTNAGNSPWTAETGLLSIWILGMFRPSAATTVVIPIRPGPESELGPPVNDAYFGRVPSNHLAVVGNHVFFRADGTRRGKIGVSPRRSLGVAGSWAADQGVLTLVTYQPPESGARYVNSAWELQSDPFDGDVINAYNDGPPAPGLPPLGPFYEIETSSPGGELAPGATLRHVSRTYHVRGPRSALDVVARAALGVGLEQIERVFLPAGGAVR
ncbi:MAG: hypothetical protein N2652_06320 [Kiritimatiellae bacterium]|nr:hypothetical protein [Kiritimatiellia bacterium]